MGFFFTKVADNNTPVPGGMGTFTDFGGFGVGPSYRDGSLTFVANSGSLRGIYTNVGGTLNLVADTNTPIPGGTGNFGNIGPGSISNGFVAFRGFDTPAESGNKQGIYTNLGGNLHAIVDPSTPIPNGVGNFQAYSMFYSFSAGHVAFCGTGSGGQDGIYTNLGGSISIVADTHTPIPGGVGNFMSFGSFNDLDHGQIALVGSGSNGQTGIYTNIGGTLSVVADTHTAIPGGTGNFTSFASISLSQGNLAFVGFGSNGQNGIYTNIGGTLSVVADTHTAIPGGTGDFSSFGPFTGPSLSGTHLVFTGSDSMGNRGLYTNLEGTLQKILAPGDILDGKVVVDVIASPEALDGQRVAFGPAFSDNSDGVFIATPVPEPSAVILFAVGALCFLETRWRRRR
jgi:hypothetical protein